jgi:hypothetical protein
MVGNRRWEKWMTSVCKPFTKAKVKYFDRSEVAAAWTWLRQSEEDDKSREEDRTLDMPTEADRSNPWIWYGL